MRIRYVIKSEGDLASVERAPREINADLITIGRGTSCDIILESKRVSLKHAQLVANGERVLIQDVGSSSGVQVNGALVSQATLSDRDTLLIGDVVLQYSFSQGEHTLVRSAAVPMARQSKETVEEHLAFFEKYVNISSIKYHSIALMLLVFIWFFLYPLVNNKRASWTSGQISTAHSFIENKCQSCHQAPFEPISPQQCLTCHQLSKHPASASVKVPYKEENCVECHQEHRGADVISVKDSNLCIRCHANIENLKPVEPIAAVHSFEEHPKLRVTVPWGEKNKRVSLHSNEAVDPTALKFNHKVHLNGLLRSRSGKQALQCADCHQGGKQMNTSSFKSNCQNCHALEFDARFAGKEVPHDKPDIVYEFLLASYSELALSERRKQSDNDAQSVRALPGATETSKDDAEAREFAEIESRIAEKNLFSKNSCGLCHDISASATQKSGASNFAVAAVKIPSNWMPQAKFAHAPHEFTKCETCHDVKKSEKTSDILLPEFATCTKCHAGPSEANMVRSDCVLCHDYHTSLPMPEGKKTAVMERGRS